MLRRRALRLLGIRSDARGTIAVQGPKRHIDKGIALNQEPKELTGSELIYMALMPLSPFIGFFSILFQYVNDKWMLLRYCRRPSVARFLGLMDVL